MSQHLSQRQRTLLLAELERRQRLLDSHLVDHQEGASRVEHAHEALQNDRESTRRHAMDREVDLAQSDRELAELGAVSRALKRLQGGLSYGRCEDCQAEIPFDRLKVEPEAERCVVCESRHETLRMPLRSADAGH